MMKAEYNRQGAERKELVQAISTITGEKAKYLFLPTKAYRIGNIMVWKTGTMECEDAERQTPWNGTTAGKPSASKGSLIFP